MPTKSTAKVVKKPAKCWPGYTRKPGTKAGAKGSCVKK